MIIVNNKKTHLISRSVSWTSIECYVPIINNGIIHTFEKHRPAHPETDKSVNDNPYVRNS